MCRCRCLLRGLRCRLLISMYCTSVAASCSTFCLRTVASAFPPLRLHVVGPPAIASCSMPPELRAQAIGGMSCLFRSCFLSSYRQSVLKFVTGFGATTPPKRPSGSQPPRGHQTRGTQEPRSQWIAGRSAAPLFATTWVVTAQGEQVLSPGKS